MDTMGGDDLENLEAFADSVDSHTKRRGRSGRKRDVGAMRKFIQGGFTIRAKIKRAQSASGTVKRKREHT